MTRAVLGQARTGPHILVVDDEKGIRDLLEIVFSQEGYRVETARSCKDGLEALARESPDLVLTDMRMPDGTGFEVLEAARESAPGTPVVMITAYTTTQTAIEAMKAGAYDYVSKPFDIDQLKIVVDRALERKRLADENQALRLRAERPGFGELVGVSHRMRTVFELVDRIGKTTSTVLITGESGTGKG